MMCASDHCQEKLPKNGYSAASIVLKSQSNQAMPCHQFFMYIIVNIESIQQLQATHSIGMELFRIVFPILLPGHIVAV
jgi:hypothetical protein